MMKCGLVFLCLMCITAVVFSETKNQEEALNDQSETASGNAEAKSPWYLILGVSNVYPGLRESEHEINRDINGRLGSLFPRWNKPETFSDWRDEMRLWDLQVGVGRHLSPRWSAFAIVGGIMGTARTRNGYFPLGFPIHIYTKFERKVWFLASGVDYYPWGKAEFPKESTHTNPITKRLFAAKPFLEAAGGYVNVYTVGQVKIELPFKEDLAKIKHAEYYDLFYLSPRLGVDIPLSEDNQLSLMAGYLFFTRHPDEYSGASFYITFKHRF
ncbi:MAG TPA: hypothetical protein PKY35_04710 [Candidatus Hydrogenedentes bacterium]|nr:hypothetical protein [Candidatus Hydrogenedentota bacterium]HOL76310.1 hypothetical protein [Candidatus Hydrogenedentota bacterium]HPO86138.1 hypothetical protein [Candidatus Hydrogenedentota bacterium]